MLFKVGDIVPNKEVYAFDLDGTIVQTQSGNVFPKTADDWEFIGNRIDKLYELKTKYSVVFITNQKLKDVNLAKGKCESIYEKTQIPVFAALDDDFYRKPGIGIFEDIYEVAKPNIFHFIGDAAGREGDHSDCDIKFSYNITLWNKFNKIKCVSKFYTPEQFFDGKALTNYKLSGYNPGTYIKPYKKNMIAQKYNQALQDIQKASEGVSYGIVLMSGPPGSGKTSFAKDVEKLGFFRVSMDETPRANIRKLYLSHKKLVIDATHPNLESVAKYDLITTPTFIPVNAANVICVVRMDVTREMAMHMNTTRSWYTDSKKVPNIAYNVYYKKLESLEGISKNIIKVVPDIFKAPKVYAQMFALRT